MRLEYLFEWVEMKVDQSIHNVSDLLRIDKSKAYLGHRGILSYLPSSLRSNEKDEIVRTEEFKKEFNDLHEHITKEEQQRLDRKIKEISDAIKEKFGERAESDCILLWRGFTSHNYKDLDEALKKHQEIVAALLKNTIDLGLGETLRDVKKEAEKAVDEVKEDRRDRIEKYIIKNGFKIIGNLISIDEILLNTKQTHKHGSTGDPFECLKTWIEHSTAHHDKKEKASGPLEIPAYKDKDARIISSKRGEKYVIASELEKRIPKDVNLNLQFIDKAFWDHSLPIRRDRQGKTNGRQGKSTVAIHELVADRVIDYYSDAINLLIIGSTGEFYRPWMVIHQIGDIFGLNRAVGDADNITKLRRMEIALLFGSSRNPADLKLEDKNQNKGVEPRIGAEISGMSYRLSLKKTEPRISPHEPVDLARLTPEEQKSYKKFLKKGRKVIGIVGSKESFEHEMLGSIMHDMLGGEATSDEDKIKAMTEFYRDFVYGHLPEGSGDENRLLEFEKIDYDPHDCKDYKCEKQPWPGADGTKYYPANLGFDCLNLTRAFYALVRFRKKITDRIKGRRLSNTQLTDEDKKDIARNKASIKYIKHMICHLKDEKNVKDYLQNTIIQTILHNLLESKSARYSRISEDSKLSLSKDSRRLLSKVKDSKKLQDARDGLMNERADQSDYIAEYLWNGGKLRRNDELLETVEKHLGEAGRQFVENLYLRAEEICRKILEEGKGKWLIRGTEPIDNSYQPKIGTGVFENEKV